MTSSVKCTKCWKIRICEKFQEFQMSIKSKKTSLNGKLRALLKWDRLRRIRCHLTLGRTMMRWWRLTGSERNSCTRSSYSTQHRFCWNQLWKRKSSSWEVLLGCVKKLKKNHVSSLIWSATPASATLTNLTINPKRMTSWSKRVIKQMSCATSWPNSVTTWNKFTKTN